SILSGLFPPTAGSTCVLGHDVRSNMAAIQPHLGVCPQYSVLFDMCVLVGLGHGNGGLGALLAPAHHGGIQQKLSVAIAFVGGSQVVILDEPTAGVDPASRRDTRELLLKYHDDRTLILSTHHLDEAELLGDHVAVVAGGHLCCSGSPLFLRRHLGSRYYLTLVKGPPALATSKKGDTDLKDNMNPGQEREPGSQASTASVAQLLALVQSHVPGARLVRELPRELVLALPYQGALDGSFPELFRELDQRLGELGLAGFGISDTSLEEVWLLGEVWGWQEEGCLEEIFLKVVEDCAVDTGPEGAAAATVACSHRYYPALQLSPSMYGAQVSFFSEDAPGHPERARLLEALLEEAGLEETYLKNNSNRAPECTQPAVCQFSVPKVPADVAKVLASGNWTLESPSPACQCSQPGAHSLLPDCPAAAGGPPPPQAPTSSGEVVQNLTGRNLSDFLVKTYPRLVRQGLKTKKWVNEVGRSVEELRALLSPQLGGALDRILNNFTAGALGLDTQNGLKIWFNNKGWHAMVAFVNRANDALLRARLPPSPARHAHSITTLNHPLNLTKEQLSEAALMASSVNVLVSICVVFAMSFVPASFTLVLIDERVTRAKHLQCVGGLPPTLYWIRNFLWDMCNYLVPVSIVVLIFLAFQQRAYVAPANLPALLLLLLLYGMAYVVLTCFNLFIGINGSTATFVLELFSDHKLQEVSWILKWVFLIFPHFCLGWGLIDMVRNQAMADASERLGENFPPGDGQFQSPLRWEVVGKNLLAMLIQAIFLLFTLLLQDHNCLLPQPKLRLLPSLGEEGEDVARERGRVVQGATQGDVLVLRDLTKVYPGQRTPAVDRLCLGIPPGECFGLLGMNGAGKTSTFHMVTGDTVPSGGEVVLAGHRMSHHWHGPRCTAFPLEQPSGRGAGGPLHGAHLTQTKSAAAFVAAMFPGAELREVHGGRLRFQLPLGRRCALARPFGELAVHGAEHGVEDFSVRQTTLEEH
ncbi:ATP-binding cassette sub-family A member 7, partial [Eschrichtius robustus]|nr:ATP-binding cassette sub-family A member 7 [Eschrichtius robustus]